MTLKHNQVRDRLVEITLELMDEGGLELVKARTVAQKAGISVGTVYNLFGNVEGLIEAAGSRIFAGLNALGTAQMARIDGELAERIEAGAVADTPAARARFRLLALSDVYIDFVAANANRWAAVLAFNRGRPAREAGDRYLAQLDILIGIVAGVLDDSPLAGDGDKSNLAGRALWSSVHGIVAMNYVGRTDAGARQTTREQITLLVTYFVRGLYIPAEPAGR